LERPVAPGSPPNPSPTGRSPRGNAAVILYIQYGDGKAAFLGDGTHFKNVEVKERVFPGQFLLVERGKLMP
jgi:hypothetical protein